MRTSFLIACALAASVHADCNTLESTGVAYNYNKGGDDWGELTHVPNIGEPAVVAFPTCNGSSQSPIDLSSKQFAEKNIEIHAYGF